tara:strand:+ start:9343 stop:10563 length:1221 start_codon:yes stop_codon:yes gene_type:complete
MNFTDNSSNNVDSSSNNVEPPAEFFKIMKDFLGDLLTTFPEYKNNISQDELNIINNTDLSNNKLFEYCLKIYPGRFFDILYKNDEMFDNKETNTFFLPNIDFAYFFKSKITDKTKETLWKYLQLILFCISGSLNTSDSFGDTAKLFEAIDENEFKNKLKDTIDEMTNMFDLSGIDLSGIDLNGIDLSGIDLSGIDMSGVNFDGKMPNADDINSHINGLLNGKLGKLASEIAEETAKELDIDMNNAKNSSQIFEKMFKNPGKLLGMVKKVGSKLDAKLKSGEIKESELMEEASEIMKKMKNMPGMKNMEQMFKNFGMKPPAGQGKMNISAMQSTLNRNIKISKQKERMRAKLEQRKKERELKMKYSSYGNNNNIEKSKLNPSNVNNEGEILKKKKKKKKKKKNKNKK